MGCYIIFHFMMTGSIGFACHTKHINIFGVNIHLFLWYLLQSFLLIYPFHLSFSSNCSSTYDILKKLYSLDSCWHWSFFKFFWYYFAELILLQLFFFSPICIIRKSRAFFFQLKDKTNKSNAAFPTLCLSERY